MLLMWRLTRGWQLVVEKEGVENVVATVFTAQ